MHVYVLSRGIKHVRDRFWNDLSAKYLPLKITNKKTGKVYTKHSQIHVRPIELHEIVFPEEHQQIVMNTLFNPNKGKSNNKVIRKLVGVLRKFLKLEKAIEPNGGSILPVGGIDGDGMERICIGVKKDRVMNPQWNNEQLKALGLPPGEYESEGL